MLWICSKIFGGGYEGKPSIFDDMTEDDLIMAFFPCTRFEVQILMGFRGDMYQQKNWSETQKLEYCIQLQKELSELYVLITKLSHICYRRGFRMIIENPYSDQHYLSKYWCLKPKIIDTDRRERGDYFKKPTQYWFLNCEPQNNFIFEALNYNSFEGVSIDNAYHLKDKVGDKFKSTKTMRSMIHTDYANRFIREYVINLEDNKWN